MADLERDPRSSEGPGRPPEAGDRIRVHALVDTLRFGGAEFLLADFAEVAPLAGIDLSVASVEPLDPPSPAADRLRERAGLEPDAIGTWRMVGRGALRRTRAHLRRHAPDIVHTHLSTADFLGGIGARSLGIPAVTTIHADSWPAVGHRERLKTWLTTQVRRHCADTVIAVSESAKRAYLDQGRDREQHLTVVRNGIVDRSAPRSGARVRRELGLDEDSVVVTAISALRPEKNFEAAIDAVSLLTGRFPQLRLVIAGDGPHQEAVRDHASRVGNAVVLAGHREDVMELLDATDILIHPSHFDAFPTSLLEAMAASVPIVATGVGGMLEIVAADVTGMLVDPPPSGKAFARALDPLLGDRDLRMRLGEAARLRYEREFGAEPWAWRVRDVYDRVLSARRPLRRAGGPRSRSSESR